MAGRYHNAGKKDGVGPNREARATSPGENLQKETWGRVWVRAAGKGCQVSVTLSSRTPCLHCNWLLYREGGTRFPA